MKNTASTHAGPSTLLLGPAVLLFGAFALLPMVGVVALSFTKWDGLGTPTFNGFGNWTRLGHDPVLYKAVLLSLIVMAVSWLIQTPVSLLLGVFVAGHARYRALMAACFFLPLLLSSAAISVMWRDMLDPNFGLSADLAQRLHAGWLNQQWLGDEHLAVLAVTFVLSWQFIPFHILLYQAGTRQIPRSMYESAMLDGATRRQQFRYITLPQLRHTLVGSSTLILVGSLTSFDIVFVLTGGGPGDATRILPLHMYLTGFSRYDMGYASAIAVVLLAFGLLVSTTLVRVTGFRSMRSTQEGA
ncbi:carbohydrate ABC transporter permease [Actinoallomurus sp. CA-150999]|uniref:carbohydrate ABC transporter permease n=1 Tax=Actinoallomurus sp. CA-150999 TaxID=3239887 RepID=UPI003D8CB053